MAREAEKKTAFDITMAGQVTAMGHKLDITKPRSFTLYRQ
jgi:hypothetical protein